ncbi:MAG: type II secretion system protein [Candidatus Shapirobacteria bacterium]
MNKNSSFILKGLGFTIVEMIIVVSIIAILMAVVLISIDPAKRFSDSRNTKRMADVDTILIAVHQYINDTGGSLPTGIGTSFAQIGTCTTGGMNLCIGATTRCANIGTLLGNGKYIKSNPTDPQRGTAATTGYAISKAVDNVFTVKACLSEGTTILVSK